MSLYDLVRVRTATTGTGLITLGTAVDGGRTFVDAGVPDGATVSYSIEDGANREVGRGTYNSGAGTLTRTLTASSTGSLISLSGAAKVSISALSADFASVTAPVKFDTSSAGTWIVPHGLGRRPIVQVFLSSGEQVFPDVFVDTANITAVFATPTAGFLLAF